MKPMEIFGGFVVLALILTSSGDLRAQTPSTDSASSPQAGSLQTAGGQAGQDKVLRKVETYDELLTAIRKTRQEAEVRVEQSKVREVWETGKLIDEHVLLYKERAEYGANVIERLAKDLGMSETELKYTLAFARAYPIRPTSDELTWSDYRELLSLNDSKQRDEVSLKAASEKWNTQKIRSEVKRINELARTGTEPPKQLVAVAGAPGVYRIIRAKVGPFAGELVIDVGFSNYKRLADVTEDTRPFEEGGMAEFSGSGPDGEVAIFTAAEAKNRGVRLYYYNAYIYKVIDGDTVTAVVDLGFGFATTQTLRLRGIDTPEIKTAEGVEAKKALEKMLGKAESVERGAESKAVKEKGSGTLSENKMEPDPGTPVLIKTTKSDKYDRYLVDIWVEGVYVNQELVDQGHAVVVEA